MKQQAARSNDLSHLSPPCLGRWRQERALADYDGFERGMAEALIKNSSYHVHIWKSGSAASPGPCHWKTPIDSAGVRAATR